jgi:hypothetical protein
MDEKHAIFAIGVHGIHVLVDQRGIRDFLVFRKFRSDGCKICWVTTFFLRHREVHLVPYSPFVFRFAMSSITTRTGLLIRIADPKDSVAWAEFVELYEPILIRVAKSKGLLLSFLRMLSRFTPCMRNMTHPASLLEHFLNAYLLVRLRNCHLARIDF